MWEHHSVFLCLFACFRACFRGRFLVRVRVCVFSWTHACFLSCVFSFFSFINSQPIGKWKNSPIFKANFVLFQAEWFNKQMFKLIFGQYAHICISIWTVCDRSLWTNIIIRNLFLGSSECTYVILYDPSLDFAAFCFNSIPPFRHKVWTFEICSMILPETWKLTNKFASEILFS